MGTWSLRVKGAFKGALDGNPKSQEGRRSHGEGQSRHGSLAGARTQARPGGGGGERGGLGDSGF